MKIRSLLVILGLSCSLEAMAQCDVVYDDVTLCLPVRDNFPITQGPGGTTSHKDIHANTGYESLDFLTPKGTPVYSATSGTVIYVIADETGTCKGVDDCKKKGIHSNGNFVRILTGDGKIATVYAHLHEVNIAVVNGASISDGQEIGKSGNTGWSGGAHLHWGIKVFQSPLSRSNICPTYEPCVEPTEVPQTPEKR